MWTLKQEKAQPWTRYAQTSLELVRLTHLPTLDTLTTYPCF